MTTIPGHRVRMSAGRAKPERPVAVLVVIFTVDDNQLHVLLVRRSAQPCKDAWSLPGGFMAPAESPDDAAVRKLAEETGVADVFLEQLYTFSDLDGRTSLAVAYFALVDSRQALLARRREWLPKWFSVAGVPPLAFRNEEVVDYA